MASPRSSSAAPGRLRGSAGFTLVETLVALTVLGAVSPPLYRVAVMLRGGTVAVDDRTRSEIVARTLLDAALARRRFEPGTVSGLTDGRRWSIATEPLDLDWPRLPAPAQAAATAPQAILGGGARAPAVPSRPDADATRRQAPWAPVRLRIRVETATRPLQVETVALVREARP